MTIFLHIKQRIVLRCLVAVLALMSVALQAQAESALYKQLSTYSTEALIAKGKSYMNGNAKPDSALVCFSIVAARYHDGMTAMELEQTVYALNRKWLIYFYNYYNYEKATEALSNALALCEQNSLSKSTVLLNFGNMNHLIAEQTGDSKILAATADYYNLALTAAKKEESYFVYITALNNLIAIRYQQGDLERFNELRKEVDSLELGADKPHSIYAYHFFYGITSLKSGECEHALQHFKQIADLLPPKGNNTYYRYMAAEGQALSLAAGHNFGEAIALLLEMEHECLRFDKKDVLLYLYKTLSDLYRQAGLKEKADEFYGKYLVARDRLISYRQLVSFSEVKFLKQLRDDEHRMAQMQYRHRTMMYGLAAVAVFASIILVLLLLVHRKSRILARANRDLYIKNEELLENEEQERRRRVEFEQLLKQVQLEEKPKYYSYKLDDEQQQELADSILRTLEMSSEIYEPEFSVVRLAELVGASAKDVSKAINVCFNCNFNVLLNKYRVQEACRRISRHGDYAGYTIEAIGNSVGYKSRSAFIAAFKHFTGLKPSEYQRMSIEGRE